MTILRKGLLLAGMLVPLAPVAGQGNPFIPGQALDRAAIEALVKREVSAAEARLLDKLARSGQLASAGAAGAVGPGDPSLGVAPPPGGLMGPAPGAALGNMPGAMPPASGDAALPPSGLAVERMGARMVGCVDGRPVFRDEKGGRVILSQRDIDEAVRAGVIRRC